MSLLSINDAATAMEATAHSFTAEEKEFIISFAFHTNSKDKTNKLIDEIHAAKDEQDSKNIMSRYQEEKESPDWIQTVENLLISLEMYRIEEEKAINRLTDILKAYGIDVSYDEIKELESENIRQKVQEGMGDR